MSERDDGAVSPNVRRARREEVLTRLHEATRELIRASSPEAIGEIVIETAEEVLDLSIVVVATVDEEREVLRPLVVSDEAAAQLPEVENLAYGPGTFPWGLFESGAPSVFADIGEYLPEMDQFVGTAILVPLGDHGLLAVGSSDERSLDAADVDFAKLLAANAQSALDRTAREVTLRAERDRIAALFQNASDAMIELRYTQQDDATIQSVNPAFETIFGFDGGSVVDRSLFDVLVPHTEGLAARQHVELARRGERFEREVRRETATGVRDFLLRVVPLDADGDPPTRAYAIYTDITEQATYTRTLGRLHETTRELVRATTREEIATITVEAAKDILDFPINAVRLYDAETDRLRPVATSADIEDWMGERPVYGPGDGPVWDAFTTGEPVVVEDLEAVDDRDYGAVCSAMYLPLGDYGTISIGSTETNRFTAVDRSLAQVLASNAEVALERTEREQELRDREAELARQNERLEAFASVVSHDLRNPLSVACGYLDLLEAEIGPVAETEPTAEYLDRIGNANERIERLIGDLLSLARQGRALGETEVVSLADVTRMAWQTVDTADATLTVDGDRRLLADRDRLCGLFENLFRNAVSHAGPDASVTVTSTPTGFTVDDDGPGIPPAVRDRVFDRGFTTVSDGTGFGLAIVAEIVEAHQWEIVAGESDTGGARFEITGVEAVEE